MNFTEVISHEWTTETIPSSESETEEYIQRHNPAESLADWKIEEAGWVSLLALPRQLQDEIIDSWRPRDRTNSVDGLLNNFMKTRLASYLERKEKVAAVTKYYKMSIRHKKITKAQQISDNIMDTPDTRRYTCVAPRHGREAGAAHHYRHMGRSNEKGSREPTI